MKKISTIGIGVIMSLHVLSQTSKQEVAKESFTNIDSKKTEASIPLRTTIEGIVKDANTGEVLVGATIFVLENDRLVTVSDYNGFYSMQVPIGTYTLVCSYISYEESHMPRVIFEQGKTKQINFQLATSSISINQVTVTARANVENELVALTQQQKAVVMETSMGASELSRKGASNVAAGVKKMSGISMIGNSQLFVRGLGDRYNQSQINGMPIPSPDPTKKVINLTLFPSDVVKTIGVSKVYTPTNNGDYSGALINIETKDYPDKKFVTVGGGIGYNSQTTGNAFQLSSTQARSFIGIDAATRNAALPDQYKTINRRQNSLGTGSDIFSSPMGYQTMNALPAMSAQVSAGTTYALSKSKLGVFFTSSFDNDFNAQLHVYDAELKADGTIKNKFYKDSYTYSTLQTNLLNIAHISSKGSIIKCNAFYTSSTEDVVEQKYDGWSNESDSLHIYNTEYTNNRLAYVQLLGKTTLKQGIDVEWKTGYSNALNNVPDRRQVSYIKNNNRWTIYHLNLQESLRAFIEQTEEIYSGEITATLKKDAIKTKFVFGTQAQYKTKEYESFVYYYHLAGVNAILTDPTKPNDIFSQENFAADKIYVKNGTTHPMNYSGNQILVGTFVDAVYSGFDKTIVQAGVRYEYSDLRVVGYNQAGLEKPTSLKAHDVLPAINTKYSINEKSNVRVALSRTITRPSFYETSPATIIPVFGEPKTEGNQNLTNAYNANFDAKYDRYPAKGEMISIGIYGKSLTNPIEMVAKPTGGTILYTFKNTERGYASGVELEYKKLIQNKYFVGCNASYIYTFIEVDQNANETEKKRAMQGASPYVINADAGYQITYGNEEQHTSSVALVYNVYGKRLYAVGTDGMGSVFEMPYNTLDLLFKNKLFDDWNVQLNIRNILNPSVRYTQGVKYNQTTESYTSFEKLTDYKKGVSASISISYTIN